MSLSPCLLRKCGSVTQPQSDTQTCSPLTMQGRQRAEEEDGTVICWLWPHTLLPADTCCNLHFRSVTDLYIWANLPRADKMAADQKISPMSAGIKSRPPILFPYSCWKGSSIVTYPRERIGFAKKSPPEWAQQRELWWCWGQFCE